MPKRRVFMLRTICLFSIAKNLSSYSNEVLQNLPWELSEDLIDKYDEEFELFLHSKKYDISRLRDRNRLISRNIRCLNLLFSNSSEQIWKDTITCVLKSCQNLTSITCNDGGTLPDKDLLELVQCIPNIVQLILPNKNTGNNDILAAIGDNCPKLEILSFSSSRITDDGIRRLIQSKWGGCNLKSLMVGDQITGEGCLIALQNLKQLRLFNCLQVIDAFKNLFRNLNGSTPSTFELCELPRIVMDKIPPGFLHFLIECCPNIICLKLAIGEYYDYHLNELRSCSAYSISLLVAYIDASLPSMSDIGSNVTALILHETDVDLPFIGHTCPNLKKLCLWKVEFLPIETNADPVKYSKLIKLIIIGQSIRTEHLKFLLENCVNLQYLDLRDNDVLNDGTMMNILHGVNLKHLTTLAFERCNAISKSSILEVLAMENKLEQLTIKNCQYITKRDLTAIKGYVKKNCYPINLNKCLSGSDHGASLKKFLIVFVVAITIDLYMCYRSML